MTNRRSSGRVGSRTTKPVPHGACAARSRWPTLRRAASHVLPVQWRAGQTSSTRGCSGRTVRPARATTSCGGRCGGALRRRWSTDVPARPERTSRERSAQRRMTARSFAARDPWHRRPRDRAASARDAVALPLAAETGRGRRGRDAVGPPPTLSGPSAPPVRRSLPPPPLSRSVGPPERRSRPDPRPSGRGLRPGEPVARSRRSGCRCRVAVHRVPGWPSAQPVVAGAAGHPVAAAAAASTVARCSAAHAVVTGAGGHHITAASAVEIVVPTSALS